MKNLPIETRTSNGRMATLLITQELERVRRRANARLGPGIDPRFVRRMMAKLTSGEKKR